MATLSFHGGVREVTGASHLLETTNAKVLIDCGLFQGCSGCEDYNFEEFHFNPKEIDAVFVSHAHLDHIGRIPKLVRHGFSGKIISTAPTKDMALPLLEDALSLATREHKAFYGEDDVAGAFKLWETKPYYAPIKIKDIEVRLHNSGHILGSAMVQCSVEGKEILFTGDLGNVPSILLPPPDLPKGITHLIIESTYGNRSHEPPESREIEFERTVEDVASRGGVLLIPAFATERTQDILHLLNEMLLFKRVPEMPVFVDSPLAIKMTKVYEKYPEEYNESIKKLFSAHPNLFSFKKLQFAESVDESKAINGVPPPKVIIAGSGMMSGGRVLHHAERYLADPKSILLFVGYQSAGSLGRRLIDGEKNIKLFGKEIFVKAEIRKINGFSAHADNPQLFAFVNELRDDLRRVFMVHGEEAQSLHFMQEVKDRMGIQADTPKLYEKFEI